MLFWGIEVGVYCQIDMKLPCEDPRRALQGPKLQGMVRITRLISSQQQRKLPFRDWKLHSTWKLLKPRAEANARKTAQCIHSSDAGRLIMYVDESSFQGMRIDFV